MNGRIVALVIGAVILLIAVLAFAHASPAATVLALYRGSLGSAPAISGTLRESTPLLIAGLAVFLGLRAGLFNIGVEGQLLVGALACAAVALRLPGFVGVVAGSLAAMVAGAAWAWPAGWIKAYRNGHEVITTIMLNNVAALLTGYLVSGPLRDASQGEPTTKNLSDGTRMPAVLHIGNFEVSSGLLLGAVAAMAIGWWLRRTVAGYELRAVGGNPTAARFAGIDARGTIMRAMMASGAIAGFAGAVQVLAYEGRFYSGFSPGYGFDALGVALLAGGSAVAVLPASLIFGVLAKGGTAMQIDAGVPKGITTVVLGCIILVAAAIRYRGARTVA